MSEFLTAVTQYSFMRNAVITGLLASVACGVMGAYVVTRRIALIAGSLAHTVLGGMGAAYYARATYDWQWLHPVHGAIVAAVIAALIIGNARGAGREREDTVISALWAIGMAIGVIFLFQTPGYKADLMTYLFGNIVLADVYALRLLAVLDIAILAVAFMFYNQLLAVSFDEEFARVRGLRIGLYHTLLLILIALTIVTLIYVVGIVLVIALLTLPVAIAGWFSRKLWHMMLLGAILSSIFTTLGLALSYEPDLPPGATTILLAGAVYVVARILRTPLKRLFPTTERGS